MYTFDLNKLPITGFLSKFNSSFFQSEATVPVFADYFRSCQCPPLK